MLPFTFVAYKGSEPYSLVMRSFDIYQCQESNVSHKIFIPQLKSEQPVELPSPVLVNSDVLKKDDYERREHMVREGRLIIPSHHGLQDGFYKTTFFIKCRYGFWNQHKGTVINIFNPVPCELHVTLTEYLGPTTPKCTREGDTTFLATLIKDFRENFKC